MKIVEISDEDFTPHCPHCKRPIQTIYKLTKGIWERHVVYACSLCGGVLSIGNDTGSGL